MQTETITCQTLMMDFAADTGLLGTLVTPRRYLWTDAFAVCNFLELYRQTDDQTFLQLAIQLVDQVHHILGRHRSDSVHQGWLSGRAEEDGQQHPTIAGLRIGKELHERLPGEAPDEALEWQQDGQYFHYLTQWMHALNCLATTTRRALYLQWAQELAKAVHAAFVYSPGNGAVKRMYWKMSVDLSRPLVQSMGQHDALDGLVTYLQLEAAAQYFPNNPNLPGLKNEIQDMRAMCAGNHWATLDALGIGGLAVVANRQFQLEASDNYSAAPATCKLLEDIAISMQAYQQQNRLHLAAEFRLPFRELGLAIGFHALAKIQRHPAIQNNQIKNPDRLQSQLDKLSNYRKLQEQIEKFWLNPLHETARTWQEHAEINKVMLATCLAPETYLS
jgi:hypothetical protein